MAKFGLLSYTTKNIGDEIQSIAARRFLPSIDIYVDRERLSSLKNDNKIKTIMNGWYMHKPKSWPPSHCIDPLLISIHVNLNDKEVVSSFLSEKSKKYLIQHGPVGARDMSTLKFFKENNIPAFFSGCLTLTLKRDKKAEDKGYILAVDISDRLAKKLKRITNRPIFRISTMVKESFKVEEKFSIAEYYLALYQNAHVVITTRLHAAFPSLAMETPVLLITGTKYDPDRFSGLTELLHHTSEAEYLKNPGIYDIENPPKNKDDYKTIRKRLIERLVEFTGYIDENPTYKPLVFSPVVPDTNSEQMIKIYKSQKGTFYSDAFIGPYIKKIEQLERFYEDKKAELRKKSVELEKIKESRSWMLTAPLRRLQSKNDKPEIKHK